MKAIVRAYSNIAFIKYWGNKDDNLRLPLNSTLSMNLHGVSTDTKVEWLSELSGDILMLNGQEAESSALERVSEHLDFIRNRLNISSYALVESTNNFPMGAGIASSASSFAALTLAATHSAGAELTERELTTIARLGSGSASRSIPEGFVMWHEGDDHETSYAESIAPAEHWNLIDVIGIVSKAHKKTGSRVGHTTAKTSDLQVARIAHANERFEICKEAVLNKDFQTFANVVELDSNMMHAVMMTSNPRLMYWSPVSLTIMQAVQEWRSEGLKVCYTLDAGPNVHCICEKEDADVVRERLKTISGVMDVRYASVGQGAHVLPIMSS